MPVQPTIKSFKIINCETPKACDDSDNNDVELWSKGFVITIQNKKRRKFEGIFNVIKLPNTQNINRTYNKVEAVAAYYMCNNCWMVRN